MNALKKALRGSGSLLRSIWRHPKGRVGLILALILALTAIFAPLLAPYNPYDVTQRAAKGLAHGAGKKLYVAVNGVRGMLQKGKTIYVSEAIAEVVRNSMTQEEKAEAFIRQNAK